ncbi:hypothetical protein Tco_0281581 [Tanacetum coccineum]
MIDQPYEPDVNTPVSDKVPYHRPHKPCPPIDSTCQDTSMHICTLIARTTSLQTQLTTALGRISTLEAKDPEPHDGTTEEDGSSS